MWGGWHRWAREPERKGKNCQCGEERAGRKFVRQEQLKGVGVDVGRRELLEGLKVNCGLFESDILLRARGGCRESALFGQSRAEGKVLEMAFSAIINREGRIRSPSVNYTKT